MILIAGTVIIFFLLSSYEVTSRSSSFIAVAVGSADRNLERIASLLLARALSSGKYPCSPLPE